MKTAEEIVRTLAAAESLHDCHTGCCVFCGAFRQAAYPERVREHEADCPYRMAVEWVGSQRPMPLLLQPTELLNTPPIGSK